MTMTSLILARGFKIKIELGSADQGVVWISNFSKSSSKNFEPWITKFEFPPWILFFFQFRTSNFEFRSLRKSNKIFEIRILNLELDPGSADQDLVSSRSAKIWVLIQDSWTILDHFRLGQFLDQVGIQLLNGRQKSVNLRIVGPSISGLGAISGLETWNILGTYHKCKIFW